MSQPRYYVQAHGKLTGIRHWSVQDRLHPVPLLGTLGSSGRVFFSVELAERLAADLNLAYELAEARAARTNPSSV
jgi:hypothetical protein